MKKQTVQYTKKHNMYFIDETNVITVDFALNSSYPQKQAKPADVIYVDFKDKKRIERKGAAAAAYAAYAADAAAAYAADAADAERARQVECMKYLIKTTTKKECL